MTDSVLDASALIAFLLSEPGADKVRPLLPTAIISAVNLAETYGKLVQYGKRLEDTAALIGRLRLRVRATRSRIPMAAHFRHEADSRIADRAAIWTDSSPCSFPKGGASWFRFSWSEARS